MRSDSDKSLCGYSINGLFLTQPLGGIQRYAYEMVHSLDAQISGESRLNIEIVVPEGTSCPEYANIKTVEYGRRKGIAWEQFDFAHYLKSSQRVGINLCNTLPLLYPKGITAIHDVSYKINPQFFTGARNRASAIWHRINYAMAAKKADTILTVSDFSKEEISREYGVCPEKIVVTPNAWQHMSGIKADDEIVEKLDLHKGDYYLSASSLAPNKNIDWILESARLTPDALFLVAGGSTLSQAFDDVPDNVVFVGRVTDGELKSLMAHCKAFLFPTFYEGFGLPPLEAMACGALAVVSDTPCMHEVYGDSVVYVDPVVPYSLDSLPVANLLNVQCVLERFSWIFSAEVLLGIIKGFC